MPNRHAKDHETGSGLLILGQGDYRREYFRCDGDRSSPAFVLRHNISVLQARAGAVAGRAGYIGHAFQTHGTADAVREMRALGQLVDDLRTAMDTVTDQLDGADTP